jgi:hypothetical protein
MKGVEKPLTYPAEANSSTIWAYVRMSRLSLPYLGHRDTEKSERFHLLDERLG